MNFSNQDRWNSKDLRRWRPLGVALLAALLLRLALWGRLPRQGFISDEGEYLAAAAWLAQGRGFTWHQGWLWTRAPLYPLFLAAHLRLAGTSLTPIYMTQLLLGLVQTAQVYALACYIVPADPAAPLRYRLVPALAALLMALYFPLAIYTQVLLSETLFITLLLGALLALAAWEKGKRQKGKGKSHSALALLALGGGLLGLATLTRGLALGFAPL